MEEQIKELIESYRAIRSQSILMSRTVSMKSHTEKLESAIVTFDLVISDLELLLNTNKID